VYHYNNLAAAFCIILFAVLLCCINTGYSVECVNKQCSSVIWDYVLDTDSCRTQGRSYWIITLLLSFIPLPGLSSLYRGKKIDGIFELFHGIFSYCLCGALDDISRGKRADDGFGGCMIFVTLIADVAKIAYMYYTEIEAMTDLIIIIPLTILAVFVGAINSNNKSGCLAIALGLTAPTGIIKYFEHILMTLGNWEVDVNKCDLVSISDIFK